MTYSVRLPRDPSPANPNTPGKSYQFQLNGALWFGMPVWPEGNRALHPESVLFSSPRTGQACSLTG